MHDASNLAIDAHNVVKTYGRDLSAVYALRGVDLQVSQAEVLFLTGPSGSGKTTLLSVLGCVLQPSSGTVQVLGRDILAMNQQELAAFRLHTLGFVFQGHNLIGSLSALANVRLPLMLQGVLFDEAQERAAKELSQVGLSGKLDKKPNELSGGQKQRVAIARALVTSPPLILADEPTASLDAKSGREVVEILSALARERGHTVVIVTHDNRIFDFADRMIAMEDGQITPHHTHGS